MITPPPPPSPGQYLHRESDDLRARVREWLASTPRKGWIQAGDLHRSFAEWAQRDGTVPLGKAREVVSGELKDAGFTRDRHRGLYFWWFGE